MIYSWDDIENLRDPIYHRTPLKKVRTIEMTLDFVNKVGFCFAFKANNSELPCLWHAACGERDPEYPLHTHHDPYISLVWQAKDTLPGNKSIYYGKALKKRPTMISLEYFPYFYALRHQNSATHSYMTEYMRGELSPEAKQIMDALEENSPQITADLKLASKMAHPQKRYIFDRAMAELQSKMYIVKIAEFYDPFTFLWERVEKRFVQECQQAADTTRETALIKILLNYFKNVLISRPQNINRLFGWNIKEINDSLDTLVMQGHISANIQIKNEKKPIYGMAYLME